MAAITTAQAGNWNDTATWTGGVIPVLGVDTVTLNHAVTIPVGYVGGCGTYPADDTGAVALAINAALTINGTLKWAGPVRQANATVIVGAGAIITYDASGAATPNSALYTWKIGSANNQANAKIVLNGLSISRCTINSVANVRSGGFGNLGTSFQDGGRVEGSYVTWSYQGANTTSGVVIQSRLNSSFANLHLLNCTFDNCGYINVTAIGAAASVRIEFTKITNSNSTNTSLSYAISIDPTLALRTTGTRTILNCDIAGRVYFLGTGSVQIGFILKNNVLRPADPSGSVTLNPLAINTGAGIDVFDQNLIASIEGNQDPNALLGFGSYTNSYLYRQCNPATANNHPLYVNHLGGDCSIDGWVFQITCNDTGGDMVNFTNDPTVNRLMNVKKCIYLPNAVGNVGGSLMLQQGTVTQDNDFWSFDHNTIHGGLAATSTISHGVAAEAGGAWVAGIISSIRSNLYYCQSSKPGYLVQPHSTAVVADGSIVVADYNAFFNVSTDPYTPVDAKFGTAPGAHDLNGIDPLFIDGNRSILNFDQGYLGQSIATAWADTTAYSVGDVRSCSVATFYGGMTINWRCTLAHTSAAATDKPGSGTSWASKWEPYAVSLISADILAGNTYNGGTNSLIGELVSWVKIGHTPQASAYSGAAHDGTTIGAVQSAGATSYTLTGPSGGAVGVTSTDFTVTPNGQMTGTVTPSDGGAGGTFTPTSLSWSAESIAKTFTYTPSTQGTKTISVTNTAGLPNPSSLSYVAQPAPPTAGITSLYSNNATQVVLQATDASDGTLPLSYQWHRGTTNGFTAGVGTQISGATNLTLTHTPPDHAVYWYRLVYTDADGRTAQTADFPASTPQIGGSGGTLGVMF